jgi:hypothetical protein
MPDQEHTAAEVRVKPTDDIPNEPCALCSIPVKDTGIWLVFDEGGDPQDLVLHTTCAKSIGTLAEMWLKTLERRRGK